MALRESSETREVGGITSQQKQRICDFLQGAVYCWCKNRADEWFSMRDLMGGDNYDWDGTPLFVLYQKHEGVSDDPVGDAGKESGWLLKKVISDDQRVFESMREEQIRKYRWVE